MEHAFILSWHIYYPVLLDHGIYKELDEGFRRDYCQLWKALILLDANKILQLGERFGVGKYSRYFPLIFTGRTIDRYFILFIFGFLVSFVWVKQSWVDTWKFWLKLNLKEERNLLFETWAWNTNVVNHWHWILGQSIHMGYGLVFLIIDLCYSASPDWMLILCFVVELNVSCHVSWAARTF